MKQQFRSMEDFLKALGTEADVSENMVFSEIES
jgi:hypothetical protein